MHPFEDCCFTKTRLHIHTQHRPSIISAGELITESLVLATCQDVCSEYVAVYPTMCFMRMSQAFILPSIHP